MLHEEGPVSPYTSLESDTRMFYDLVAGELLRRRDIESIPLLLLRANDPTEVRAEDHQQAWLVVGKYHAPVLTKYKVRFLLSKLLDPDDYRVMIGEHPQETIDLAKALSYYRANKVAIQARLQKLLIPEEAPEKPKKTEGAH